MIYLLIIMGDEDKAKAVRKLTGRIPGIQVISPPTCGDTLKRARDRISGHAIEHVVADEASAFDRCITAWDEVLHKDIDAARVRR